MYDSAQREHIIRHLVEDVAKRPERAEEVIAHLAQQWEADVQDVHERSYSDGAEGVMA